MDQISEVTSLETPNSETVVSEAPASSKRDNDQCRMQFQPEFIENIVDEGFSMILERLQGDEKDLLDRCMVLEYFIREEYKGQSLSQLTLDMVPDNLAVISRLIWKLGGTFYNSLG